jgi:hypothetical protein
MVIDFEREFHNRANDEQASLDRPCSRLRHRKGNLEKVRQMLEEHPELIDMPYSWSETDHETAFQGAAQVGNVPIAKYLLEKGAPLKICTAARLGRKDEVEKRIRDKRDNIHSREPTAHRCCPTPLGAATLNLSSTCTETETVQELDRLPPSTMQLAGAATISSSGWSKIRILT